MVHSRLTSKTRINLQRQERVRILGSASILLPGLLVVAVTAAHLLGHDGSPLNVLVGTLAVVGLGLPLIAGSYWMYMHDLEDRDLVRIALWTYAGVVPITGLSVLVILYQWGHGVALAEPSIVVSWVTGVGATGGFLTGVYDVRKERKRTELDEVSSRLHALAEASPVAIVGLDAPGHVTDWSSGAEDLFGWSRETVLGEPYPVVPEDRRREYERNLARVMRGETITDYETKRQHRDGSLIDVGCWLAPVRNAEGEVEGAMLAVADVSERKRREQRLAVLRRVLRHNLSNAVTVIQGNASLLAGELEEEAKNRAVETIQHTAADLGELGEKARAAERAFERDSERTKAIDELFERERRVFERTHTAADLQFEVPAKTACTCGPGLQTAVHEAIENAIEHNDRDSPTVQVEADCASHEETVRIRVIDEGPGIPDLEREVIEEGTETDLQHSTGLGLWLMEWITRELGGEITIEDNDPTGTVVTFTVPRTMPVDRASDTRPAERTLVPEAE
jgi:PAS domain S-box-containing protein